jgi:hypothetical protein
MDRRRGTRQDSLWISIVSVLLIVCAVAAALATLQHLPANGGDATGEGSLSAGVTLDINYMTELSQLQGIWFSPNGLYIATLGVYTPCLVTPDQLPACDHGLAIIDTRENRSDRVMPIEISLGIPTLTDDRVTSEYLSLYGLGWTPNSTWFGMIYSVFSTPSPQTPNDFLDSGLLLENPTTGQATIIRGDSGYFATLGGLAANHPIWDIQDQVEQLAPPLSPALAYTWDNANMPQPLVPVSGPIIRLPAVADSFSPIGNPDGQSPFTIWQPGILVGPGSARLPSQRSAFIATFPAWSVAPATDAQRVGVFTLGISLPTPVDALSVGSASASVGAPHLPQPNTFITAPARDPALTNVQDRIGAYGWALVAWSPSGGALASIICYNQHGEALELRDTLSGNLNGQQALSQSNSDPGCRDLAQPQRLGAYLHANLALAWAPTGRELALVDSAADTITIWQYTPTN